MSAPRELQRASAELADRFDARTAREFGQRLPALIADVAQEWGLRVGDVLDTGATSVVLEAVTLGGAPAVLKLSPDAAFLHRQSQMMTVLSPTGRAPAVLAHRTEVLLLERVVPGLPVSSDQTRPPSVHEWASLLRDLHAVPTAGIEERLTDRCEEMFTRIGARQARAEVRDRIPDEAWHRMVAQCRELLEAGPRQVSIHGDLHLGNVLASDSRGLMVIDPKLCVGDPCFDMVDFVVVSGSPEEFTSRAQALAPLVGVPTDHLLAWSRVNAVVTAVSRLSAGRDDARNQHLLAFAGL